MLLAKLFGLYMLIGGSAIIIRRRYFIPVVGAFVTERLTRMVVAILEVIGGLLLVLLHPYWTPIYAGIISFFAWSMLLEGIAYLLLPDELIEKLIRRFNTRSWYLYGGILTIILGAYLTLIGFSIW